MSNLQEPMAEDEQGQKKQTVRINLPPKQTSTATVKVAGPPAKKAATKAAAAPAKKAAAPAGGGGAATGAPSRRPVARRQAAPAASGMDVALAVITLALCAVTCVQLALIVLKGTQS